MLFLIKKCKKKVFFFPKKNFYIYTTNKKINKSIYYQKKYLPQNVRKKTKKKVDCMRVLLFKQKKEPRTFVSAFYRKGKFMKFITIY